jgi:pimeloyl-ACP methyl ester carboxylesterase
VPLLQLDGARVNITDTGAPPGRPDAPVVVLGHGLLFSTTMWRHQVDALRATYRCVAVDWRGQGATPPAPAYDMDSLYADLVGVIEHLDGGPVHYAGLSMGGFVGLRLAARRPDLVRSLTLIDTSAGPEDPEKVSR